VHAKVCMSDMLLCEYICMYVCMEVPSENTIIVFFVD
jgi:hypothetical protein